MVRTVLSDDKRIRVAFGEPKHGWMSMTIETLDRALQWDVPHAGPDSIGGLVTALEHMWRGYPEAKVQWNEEPTVTEFVFQRRGDVIELAIQTVRYTACGQPWREGRLCVVGDFGHIGKPFWRALASLTGRNRVAHSKERWDRNWGHVFPSEALERLGEAIRQRERG